MLIIDGNSVYEIDEECLKRRSVPEECEVYKKIVREREVATTDVAVEMTAYGSSYFFSAVADVVTETASANRRQTSMGNLKFP